VSAEIKPDEVHSTFQLCYKDGTNNERVVGVELAASAEYKKLRSLAKQIARHNQPPFTVVKDGYREVITHWRDLLTYVRAEGMRDASVQRYKGLGEMNSDQLWETTMNPEKRTLLQVRLEDMVECEEIFSTLMGENVEARRKFIEDNALDVRNLDV
jgi:DNA gyrase subunit B